jgi:hypothetical protein
VEDVRAIVLAAVGRAFPCSSNGNQQPQPAENATDVCARRCLPPGGFEPPPGAFITRLPASTEACLKTCGEEMGRGR